ncbi:hypothetical protein P8452_01901 [Trifolium repens]|nr:hypothetical protein P8452_01901 [Trifolium repens]
MPLTPPDSTWYMDTEASSHTTTFQEEQDAMKQNTIEGKLLLEQVTGSKSHASQSNEATSSMPAVIAVTQLDPT